MTPVVDPTKSPYNAVVHVNVAFNGATTEGSGVLISPDEVLTADHVSYRNDQETATFDGVAGPITVTPAAGIGTAPYGSYNGTVAHYFRITDTPSIPFSNIQSDYSIIHLDKPVVGVTPMTVLPDFAGGSVHVTGYPVSAGGSMIDDTQTVSTDPSYTIYDGAPLTPGFSGSPVWVTGADGKADVVGVVSASTSTISNDVKITSAVAAQIASWVAEDDKTVAPPPPPPLPPQPPAAVVAVFDTTTGASVADTFSQPYSGPVAGVQHQFVDITPDSINVTASTPN